MKITNFLLTASLVLAMVFTISCGGSKGFGTIYYSESGQPISYTHLVYGDRAYLTIEMPDGKVWMAQNLNYVTKDSKCNPSRCDRYGQFYTWDDAMNVCPAGWHLPTKEEFDAMIAAIGGEDVVGKSLKAGIGWDWASYSINPNSEMGIKLASEGKAHLVGVSMPGHGENKYGFLAMSGGYSDADGKFQNVGDIGYWWLASETHADSAYVRALYNYDDEIFKKVKEQMIAQGNLRSNKLNFVVEKDLLYNVRCVQGEAPKPVAKVETSTYVTEVKVPPPTVEVPAVAAKVETAPPVPVKAEEAEPIKDARDKKTYKTVKIGEQTWMAENLNFNAKGSKCYDNKPANCTKYGRLYNWETAMKACPVGWHLPSKDEFQTLVDAAGGAEVAGNALKAKNGWAWNEEANISGNGTDNYGFSALPGGTYHYYILSSSTSYYRYFSGGNFGSWWSASDGGDENEEYVDDDYAYDLSMGYRSGKTYITADGEIPNKGNFYSVRCIKD